MSAMKLAQFQDAAVRHIVARLRDADGSRRMLLADEVGLGKTFVARGVIQALQKGRRRPLTVVYLCSNAEIAEQNRTKLDRDSRKPIGRVTELAIDRPDAGRDLLLYSFTPGTSLKGGTGLAWERRLLLYLLHRIHEIPAWKRPWREYFRCGAGEENWYRDTRADALTDEFERKTSVAFQEELAAAWRTARLDGDLAIPTLRATVPEFDRADSESKRHKNRMISLLRGVMQRVALKHIAPDLVILDEVQRFRDVLEEANNSEHIAAVLFARRVPVLILSATPYRALTLGHEAAGGASLHHEDFFKTLEFLFDSDVEAPVRIRRNLEQFGERLKKPDLAEQLDRALLELKGEIEDDLTKVVCRTERNWYVLDRRKGIDDDNEDSGSLPEKDELQEFFLLHKALAPHAGMGQVTEFWKSAPSLLTFLDAHYRLFKTLRDRKIRVPRALLTPAKEVRSLARRNHRVSKLVDVALGAEGSHPRLWTAPTYTYYRDDYFGSARPRKVLVFSGWRFVPKTVAIIGSQVAADRMGNAAEESAQPLRFTDKWSFHVFDLCLPSPALARIGNEAFLSVRSMEHPSAEDVLLKAEEILRREFRDVDVEVAPEGRDRAWQPVMRLERRQGRAKGVQNALEACLGELEEGTAEHLLRHLEMVKEWLEPSRSRLRISEARLKRLALVAAFSPSLSLLRACDSVYGEPETAAALADVAKLCLGSMRSYFNRPIVQQVIRQHRFRIGGVQEPAEDKGYAARALVYAGDAHLQAVLDEYLYLLKNASQADDVSQAIRQIGEVWKLSRGTPRTNGGRGRDADVQIEEGTETHTAHFALAFGEDITRDEGSDEDESKLRKSVVREAFNSPFWPFVLATTSVGQEGLDFHLYCRDVFHWNLPSNPVDLEQREGRVNRRDCLAVRESIAVDWPLPRTVPDATEVASSRNPWPTLFERIQGGDDEQRYKHGLFPHWVYECRAPEKTIRIRRHVPFFSTSRDAAKYERLKTGLALYRLVFGQVNQEDLLEHLEKQTKDLDPEEKATKLRRLASYMLNLSPIRQGEALRQAEEEADRILKSGSGYADLRKLLESVKQLQTKREGDLLEVKSQIDDLVRFVEQSLVSENTEPEKVRKAVVALAYLRNPYDRVFDFQVEGGFLDDLDVIRGAWAEVVLAPPGSPAPQS